jgi:metallophosphoesterase superfamily enzyme
MQIADLHFSVSQGTCRNTNHTPCENSDSETQRSLLSVALDAEKPDLVVFTGDQLNGQKTSWHPKSVLAKFAKTVIDRNISWAAVFGNHDAEGGMGRAEQMKLLQSLPYSLSKRGSVDVDGVGNYVLKVLSPDA